MCGCALLCVQNQQSHFPTSSPLTHSDNPPPTLADMSFPFSRASAAAGTRSDPPLLEAIGETTHVALPHNELGEDAFFRILSASSKQHVVRAWPLTSETTRVFIAAVRSASSGDACLALALSAMCNANAHDAKGIEEITLRYQRNRFPCVTDADARGHMSQLEDALAFAWTIRSRTGADERSDDARMIDIYRAKAHADARLGLGLPLNAAEGDAYKATGQISDYEQTQERHAVARSRRVYTLFREFFFRAYESPNMCITPAFLYDYITLIEAARLGMDEFRLPQFMFQPPTENTTSAVWRHSIMQWPSIVAEMRDADLKRREMRDVYVKAIRVGRTFNLASTLWERKDLDGPYSLEPFAAHGEAVILDASRLSNPAQLPEIGRIRGELRSRGVSDLWYVDFYHHRKYFTRRARDVDDVDGTTWRW